MLKLQHRAVLRTLNLTHTCTNIWAWDWSKVAGVKRDEHTTFHKRTHWNKSQNLATSELESLTPGTARDRMRDGGKKRNSVNQFMSFHYKEMVYNI